MNHWTKKNVDNACSHISKEVFLKERQASLLLKFDDMSLYINQIITKRGIAKGLVKIQEDMNLVILNIEKLVVESYTYKKNNFLEIEKLIRCNLWVDIRFLMVNKSLTPGESIDLLGKQKKIEEELSKWSKAMSA